MVRYIQRYIYKRGDRPMSVREMFVPAVLAEIKTIDPGEIRAITLVLPEQHQVEEVSYPIRDEMRPGNAFLALPYGQRTGKVRRRMYTRSNAAITAQGVLQTIINHTHREKSDTSAWWQTEEAVTLQREGGTIDVRVGWSQERTHLVLYENSGECKASNLRLEPDGQWETLRLLGLAFSTGITPFLAHLRYMDARQFGRTESRAGCRYTLIVSVRNPRQLMEHEGLMDLARRFPENFRYHPVLTREWPEDWPFGKGRIIRTVQRAGAEEAIDLGPLLEVAPDIQTWHVRMCGNAGVRSQLLHGLQQHGGKGLSFRSEVW